MGKPEKLREWLREQIDATAETIALFEVGQLRLFQNGKDISKGHVQSLRQLASEMREILSGETDATLHQRERRQSCPGSNIGTGRNIGLSGQQQLIRGATP